MRDDGRRRQHRVSIGIALTIILFGVALIGGLVYVDATASLTRADYQRYIQQCDSQVDHPDGMGLPEELFPWDDQACQNVTFENFEQVKRASMTDSPLKTFQWVWYGGPGVLATLVGVMVLRKQLATGG